VKKLLIPDETNHFQSVSCIGVGAGKFLVFTPNLREKFSGNFLCKYFIICGMTSKKGLHAILPVLGANFSKSNNVGRHFYLYFSGILQIFSLILPRFSRIFDKSKLLGVRLHPHLLHHWFHNLIPVSISNRLQAIWCN